jgi:putative selenium metabolism hydrolase
MQMKTEEILNEIKDEMISFAQDLIRIKSFTCEEEEAARFVLGVMQDLGYDQSWIDDLGNVVGVMGNGPTTIMFDSHLDTVHADPDAGWTVDPFGGEIKDGKLYGRGAVDMKSAVAATVYAGYAIKKLGYDKDKTIVISISMMEEDYDGEAMDYVLDGELSADYVVICEPSSLQLALGHRGRAMVKISTPGLSAHGSTPEKGQNAVYEMAIIIKRVEELQETFSIIEGDKGSVALSKIESTAVSLNAVPSNCNIYLDRRTIVGEDEAFLTQEIEKLIQGTSATWEILTVHGESWTGKKIDAYSFYPAWEIEEQHELVEAGVKAYRDVLSRDPVKMKWEFCTNGVTSAGKRGIPTIGIGPGDHLLAHKVDEHCPLEELNQSFMFYTTLPRNL